MKVLINEARIKAKCYSERLYINESQITILFLKLFFRLVANVCNGDVCNRGVIFNREVCKGKGVGGEPQKSRS